MKHCDCDYTLRCQHCGSMVVRAPGGYQCTDPECRSFVPDRVCNFTEVEKPGEIKFTPPPRIPHPNGRK
jgi:hypothetical protein